MYNLESFQRLVKKYGHVGVVRMLRKSNFSSEQIQALENIKILVNGSINIDFIYSLC